jgi:hypothetical protein
VPVEFLKTYQQALAQYHLHPRTNSSMAIFSIAELPSGGTFGVTDVEYIGKESNKWEDQYYFGFDEDEEIRYGPKDAARTLTQRSSQ